MSEYFQIKPGYCAVWLEDFKALRKQHQHHISPCTLLLKILYNTSPFFNPSTSISKLSDRKAALVTGFSRMTIQRCRLRLIELGFIVPVGRFEYQVRPFMRVKNSPETDGVFYPTSVTKSSKNGLLSRPFDGEENEEDFGGGGLPSRPSDGPLSEPPMAHLVGHNGPLSEPPNNKTQLSTLLQRESPPQQAKNVVPALLDGLRPSNKAGASENQPSEPILPPTALFQGKSVCTKCIHLDGENFCSVKIGTIHPTDRNRINKCKDFQKRQGGE